MGNLKKRVAAGENALGTMIVEFENPNIVRILHTCGFDYLIIDCEHGGFSYTTVSNMIAAAKGLDIDVIVRIPTIARECILKFMDMGADGLLIPMVSSAEDIRKVIEYSKYKPLGNRGVSVTRAHSGYHIENMKDYMQQANDETMILAQIETVQGLDNLDEILDQAGLDGVIIGPNDLSQDMNIVNQYTHPLMEAAIQKTIENARLKGRCSGIISSNIELLQHASSQGMQVLSWNSEVGMMMKGSRIGLDVLSDLSSIR
jgi:2-keto-3-deoxy-L-rhamnonate aldolase RhmA